MNTAAIDLDMLDELFENQKKLDAAFNLSFDDDLFLESLTPTDKPKTSHRQNTEDFNANKKMAFKIEDPAATQQTRGLAYIVVPVAVEIAAISYSIIHFT
ncbi:MAG: hypothetical protein methR_P2908 [Methyloprofundus sp.]|nr:MAG: hypothetical protein methR_P2908 [Methyloprofundus sp.]